MDALIVEGQPALKGTVRISGSKNTALPLLFGSLLFDEEVRFSNVPRLWDIETTLHLLKEMGCAYEWNKEKGELSILPTVKERVASYEWVKRMRAGILALGPLVAKFGEAKVSLPGGCAIGARPVNFHLEAMKQMGVVVDVEEGYIHARVPSRLIGAEILFPEVTVTGTENILYVATAAEGETIIQNAAREPEVVSLGEWLRENGADISGLGTSRIVVKGNRLNTKATPVAIPPDRIETGTWIAIAMSTRSDLVLEATDASKMASVIEAYRQMGLGIDVREGGKIAISAQGDFSAIEVITQPYPGFPTDMQAQILTNMCQANGKSSISENIFENRFMHVAELRRLGAKIHIEGNRAVAEGPTDFRAAPIMATDLRASASLVVAALRAKGSTKISRIYHLDRGYHRLDEKLRSVGARVTRVAE